MVRKLCLYTIFVVVLLFSGCSVRVAAEPALMNVLIDPGHGGTDGGAVAEDGTLEKHINLAIGCFLRDMLRVGGVSVVMTRDTDVGLEDSDAVSIREKKVSDMHNRLQLYNSSQMVISIHQNHFSVPKYHGAQVFYSGNHPHGASLASAIRSAVIEHLQPGNTRESKQADNGIYLLHHTEVPAVLVECGFLSNPDERSRLNDPAYQQKMAWTIMLGYWNYIQEN